MWLYSNIGSQMNVDEDKVSPIDHYAKDGDEELLTKMHYIL